MSVYNKAKKEAKVQEEFKAYSVVWECNKGHKNFQTIIGKEGTQHDVCLKCGQHYEYVVANGDETSQDQALHKHIVTNSICAKANQCANTPGGCICPKNVICPL